MWRSKQARKRHSFYVDRSATADLARFADDRSKAPNPRKVQRSPETKSDVCGQQNTSSVVVLLYISWGKVEFSKGVFRQLSPAYRSTCWLHWGKNLTGVSEGGGRVDITAASNRVCTETERKKQSAAANLGTLVVLLPRIPNRKMQSHHKIPSLRWAFCIIFQWIEPFV